ncbi:MAG: helix-turn-helix domain-containing protein [Erysipelotrichaceae bacterium]|nr:helix-turn-helix domain-containing protein [Erysipelotrichaceae bacterium]
MKLRELLLQYEIQNELSHKEVADIVGVSLSTYYRWISGESTLLKRRNIDRLSELFDCDIELVIDEGDRVKPILGRVKAGYDLWADQDIEGYIELGQAEARKGDYFLRVTGDSMEGSHIFDGDIVYVQQCSEVDSGNIAVVLIGEEATIKKVYFKKDLMILESSNPKYESRCFTPEEVEELPVRVIGLVRFVRREFV